MNALTTKQHFVLYELRDIDVSCYAFQLWERLVARHGEAEFSRKSVHQHLDALEKKRIVKTTTDRRGRLVRLVERGAE